jgi:MobA/MobL family
MVAIGYHFSAKVISRSRGQSAVAAAAYRIRSRLEDERYGKTHDYSKHEGLEFVWHSAPKNAPTLAHDIGQVWNAIEREEKRSNSTLAREYVVAFPCQLSAEQREWMLKDFVREELTRKGLIVTAAIHAPSKDGDERNYHAHIMFSDRPIDENGFSKNKDRSFTDYKSRVDTLEHGKEKWAALAARQLERSGYEVEAERWRHGHEKLSQQATAAEARGDQEYADLLRFAEAGKHLGVVASEIERDGRESHRGRENREIEAGNAARQELGKELQAVEREIAALEVTAQRENQQPEPVAVATPPQVTAHEPEPYSVVTYEAQEITPAAQQEPEPIAQPVTLLEQAIDDSPGLEEIADTVERTADTAGHVAAKGVEVIGRMGAVIANGLEAFFFGGASRQAPGGAESTQEAPPPKQTREQKRETQKSMKEPPAWWKAKQQLNREPELANEANTRDQIINNPIHVSPEMEAAIRRHREERKRERERER